MTRILIPTYDADVHALAVQLAVQAKGHEAILWHGADLPTRQTASVHVDPGPGTVRWDLSDPEIGRIDPPFDTYWMRRPTAPHMPKDLHPADHVVARRACDAFVRQLWQLMPRDGFWVNDREGARRAESKANQLRHAMAVGFAVPPTLISNDPAEIRRFLARHRGQTVYKSLFPAQWKTEEGVALLFTTEIAEEDLPDDDMLRVSPGIFQRKIPKAHELRVTYIGGHLVVARLLSQDREDSQVDWKGALRDLRVEPADPLPEPVADACRAFMDRLGLVFGCLDFIVTPEGEHVFLEVNEMGQFLWVEEDCPDLHVLDPFCELLIRRTPRLEYEPPANPVHYLDLKEEVLARVEQARELHVRKVFRGAADDTGRSTDGVYEAKNLVPVEPAAS